MSRPYSHRRLTTDDAKTDADRRLAFEASGAPSAPCAFFHMRRSLVRRAQAAITGHDMLIGDILRALIALTGLILMLLGLFGVMYALSDAAWGPAFSALLGALFGFWVLNVGLTGRLSGQSRESKSPAA